jgi:hypothetical protein
MQTHVLDNPQSPTLAGAVRNKDATCTKGIYKYF